MASRWCVPGPRWIQRRRSLMRRSRSRGKREKFGELPGDVGQETIEFRLDDLIALTRPRLQPRAIDYGDLAPAVMNQPSVLQLPGSLGDTFAAHPQHVGDQLLRHGQFVR